MMVLLINTALAVGGVISGPKGHSDIPYMSTQPTTDLYVMHVMRDSNMQMNFRLAGPGFGDFTRIAQGSEEMWRDIFMSNRQAMLDQIENLHAVLDQAREALENNDFDWIESMLRETAQRRRVWEREKS
jgi:prephenate dehydrogenase